MLVTKANIYKNCRDEVTGMCLIIDMILVFVASVNPVILKKSGLTVTLMTQFNVNRNYDG